MIRWPSGRIVSVPSAAAALATGGAWTTPRSSATPVFMCSRVESAGTLMSNENGCCLPGSRSHSTVPAIVSAKEKPMPKPTPKTTKRARRPATTFTRERERQLHLGHALREREALAGAAGVTRVTGRAVGLVAVVAGLAGPAVRVGRAEAALVTRAVGAVAAGGAVRRGRALVAAADTGAGSRAGR